MVAPPPFTQLDAQQKQTLAPSIFIPCKSNELLKPQPTDPEERARATLRSIKEHQDRVRAQIALTSLSHPSSAPVLPRQPSSPPAIRTLNTTIATSLSAPPLSPGEITPTPPSGPSAATPPTPHPSLPRALAALSAYNNHAAQTLHTWEARTGIVVGALRARMPPPPPGSRQGGGSVKPSPVAAHKPPPGQQSGREREAGQQQRHRDAGREAGRGPDRERPAIPLGVYASTRASGGAAAAADHRPQLFRKPSHPSSAHLSPVLQSVPLPYGSGGGAGAGESPGGSRRGSDAYPPTPTLALYSPGMAHAQVSLRPGGGGGGMSPGSAASGASGGGGAGGGGEDVEMGGMADGGAGRKEGGKESGSSTYDVSRDPRRRRR